MGFFVLGLSPFDMINNIAGTLRNNSEITDEKLLKV